MPQAALPLMVVSLAATAVGTGMQYFSSQQQAATAQRLANYNAAVQRQNADIEAKLAQQQSAVNSAAAQAQAQAYANNAISLRNEATGIEARGRAEIDRMREEQARMAGLQRAKYARAGVVNEGSPLVVLADTARIGQLGIQDQLYQSDMEARAKRREADLQKFQGGFSLLDASMQQYQGAAAEAKRKIAYNEADLTQLSGAAQASAYRQQGTASLISGIGSLAGQGYGYSQNMRRAG